MMDELTNSKEESQNDFTFLSHSQEAYELLDHMRPDADELEKLEQRIREFEEKNSELKKYIHELKLEPEKVRQNPNGDLLKQKIELMQKENRKLREFVTSAKISAKPVELERVSMGIATPRNNKKEFLFHEDTSRNSLKSNPRNRRILEEIDDNFEKVFTDNASTCHNYRTLELHEEPRQEVELNRVEHLTETEKKIKNGLRLTAEMEYRKKQVAQRHVTAQPEPPHTITSSKKVKNMKALEEYKNQLLQQLKNSQLKESQLQKILQELKKVHRSSLEKFNEVARLLDELRASKINDQEDLSSEINLVQKYQQALQLEQILGELQRKHNQLRREQNAQQEQETIHLTNLRRQLYKIVQRLGLKVDTNGLSLEESLEVLCSDIINNVYVPNVRSVSSTNAKLLKIKELTEMEKSHNSKVIAELKSRQQALSRQLMSLQIAQNK